MIKSNTDKNIIIILFLATFIVTMDMAMVEFMLPQISDIFNIDKKKSSLIISSYIFGLIVASVCIGYLADLTSRKFFYILGLVVFATCSFILSLTENFNAFILLRLLQGASVGIISTLNIGYLVSFFPQGSHFKVFSINALSISLGYISGPLFGGWIINNFDWNNMFTIYPFILGAIALLTYYQLPEIDNQLDEKINNYKDIDYIGIIGLLLISVSIMTLFVSGNPYIFTSIFMASTIFIYFSNKNASHPVIDIYLILDNIKFFIGIFINFLSFVGAYIAAFIIPFMVTMNNVNLNSFEIGIILGSFPSGFLFGVLFGLFFTAKIHKTLNLLLASFFLIFSSFLLNYVIEAYAIWQIILTLFIVGVARGYWLSPFNSYIFENTPAYKINTFSGIVSVTRNLGSLFGTMLAGWYLNDTLIKVMNHPEEWVQHVNINFNKLIIMINIAYMCIPLLVLTTSILIKRKALL